MEGILKPKGRTVDRIAAGGTIYYNPHLMEHIHRVTLNDLKLKKEKMSNQPTLSFNFEVFQYTLTALLEEGILYKKAVKQALKAGRKAADGAETII